MDVSSYMPPGVEQLALIIVPSGAVQMVLCYLHIGRCYPQYYLNVCNKFRDKVNQTPSQSQICQSVGGLKTAKNHNMGNNSYFGITIIITFNVITSPFLDGTGRQTFGGPHGGSWIFP